jgi:hypothetical protein
MQPRSSKRWRWSEGAAGPMKTWNQFAEHRPDLAEAGQALLYQVGVGLAYLATTRPDGGPRVHPMCPILTDRGAFAFIVPSPKQRDLRRDGRYALHSFPCEDNEDAFSCSGRVRLLDDKQDRAELGSVFVAERAQLGVPRPASGDALFEFLLDGCLLTRTTGHGDPKPVHSVWRDDATEVDP